MSMNMAGKKVAILVHNYFEQSEFEEPLRVLKGAGVGVTVVTTDEEPLYGMRHAKMGTKFMADMHIDDTDPDDYDGLVLPGGALNADKLRMIPEARRWATAFLDSGRPLGIICHAPWVLVSADAVEGQRLTSYYTIQDDIKNAGGEWVNQAVVIDDNLLTSRQPDDLPAFCEAFLKLLSEYQPPGGVPQTLDSDDIESVDAHPQPKPTDEQLREDDGRLRALGYDKRRDQLSLADERDILADQDESDPDEMHPSGVVPGDEQDHTQ